MRVSPARSGSQAPPAPPSAPGTAPRCLPSPSCEPNSSSLPAGFTIKPCSHKTQKKRLCKARCLVKLQAPDWF